jgi:hypothetical protein
MRLDSCRNICNFIQGLHFLGNNSKDFISAVSDLPGLSAGAEIGSPKQAGFGCP